jgi:hypothetical protein
MPDSLDAWEVRRADLLEQIRHLGDFRPGSVTATSGRCGTPTCHCHQPHAAGHGPNFRLTFKVNGKTVTESFPTEAARRKAERETSEYRKWQQLSREFVEVNAGICRLRPLPEQAQTPQEKKRRTRSSKKSRTK